MSGKTVTFVSVLLFAGFWDFIQWDFERKAENGISVRFQRQIETKSIDQCRNQVPKKTAGKRLAVNPSQNVQEDEVSSWSDPDTYQKMELGEKSTQSIFLLNENEEYIAKFKVRVPRNVKTMRVSVDELPIPASIYGSCGLPLASELEKMHENPPEEFNMLVSRYEYLDPIEGGWYYFVVSLDGESVAGLVDFEITDLNITAEVTVNSARTDGVLALGEKQSSSLTPESGGFRTFEVEIPEGVDAVRIDLDGGDADLNLVVRKRRQILDIQYADDFSETINSRESLVIQEGELNPSIAGKWYVDVFTRYNQSETGFEIHATAGVNPAPSLLTLPELPQTGSPAQMAFHATVQVATQTGAASGTLVSKEGLILTNYHVISEAKYFAQLLNDESQNEMVIGLSSKIGAPPVELFRARVVQQSKENDLALLQITSGYYGQEIPEDYHFPFVKCRQPSGEEIGSPITIAGYPMSGAVDNNPTFSVTAGLLSGIVGGKYLKTDADISSGNSGGAAFDRDWKLIGVPTMTIEEPYGQGPTMGILMQLNLVPDEWNVPIER